MQQVAARFSELVLQHQAPDQHWSRPHFRLVRKVMEHQDLLTQPLRAELKAVGVIEERVLTL